MQTARTLRTACLLVALVLMASAAWAQSGPIGYWPFDDGVGTAASDASGNGNIGSVNGATWTTGRVGGALLFNGSGNNVRIPNSASLAFGSQVTFACWINAQSLSNGWVTVLHRGRADLAWYDWQFYARASDAPTANRSVVRVNWDNTASQTLPANEQVQSHAVLSANTWYFLAFTYDGTALRYYIDGILRGTTAFAAGTIPNGGRDIWIGGNEPWGEWFNGIIDEVRIYNRALSEAEIQALMGATPIQYTLTVNTVGNGTVTKNPNLALYNAGQTVQLTAVPSAGWQFAAWSGDLSGAANPANIVMSANRTVTATFTEVPILPNVEPFETFTAGQTVGANPNWYDAGTGPVVGNTNGVGGSRGLGSSGTVFHWVARPFNWNDGTVLSVKCGMDFETSSSGQFDDDRIGWTTNSTSTLSDYQFGIQLDHPDGGVVTYWRNSTGTRIQTPIIALGTLPANTWYRLRATITPLTSTSASIDVSLVQLDGAGNPTGTPLTGSVPNTSLWAAGGPAASYFTPTQMWPTYKNHTTSPGDADNAYFEVLTGTPTTYTLTVNTTGSGSVTKNPDKVQYNPGEVVQLTATPAVGWDFNTWSGDATGSVNPTTVTMNANRTVTANFIAEPVPGTVKFAAFGDHGDGGAGEAAVAALVKSFNPDLVITVGDNNYNNNSSTATWDIVNGDDFHEFIKYPAGSTSAYAPGRAENAFFPAFGNHDWDAGGQTAYFELPGNERYYTFVKGNVQFFCIDSDTREPDGTSSSSVQALWLQAQLAASTATWKVVYMHHPPFSSSTSHGSTPYMQWPYDQWGADVVFAGHDHVYERIVRDEDADGGNILYVTTGAGGHSLYAFGTPVAGSELRYNSNYGTVIVEATSTTFTLRFYSLAGGSTLIDTYVLNKVPLEYTLTVNVVGNGTVAKNPLKATYTSGEVVELTATPDAGWAFGGWSGDLTGTTNPTSITINTNKTVTATFTEVPAGVVYSESFNGLATGVMIGNTAGWEDGAGPSPVVTAGAGVNGSIGLAAGQYGFAWTAHPFTWTDPSVLAVIMGMDFETTAGGLVDDDRVGWTILADPNNSNSHFGVQLEPVSGSAGSTPQHIQCYWDGSSDNGGRTSIVVLPALAGNTFYRLRATFTKITNGSARIDVTLTQLAADGTPGAVVATGTIANTALLPNTAGNQVPLPGYFSAAQMWPVYKNFTSSPADADNAYFEILTSAPATYTLTVNATGSGTVTKNPDNPSYSSGQVVQLTATPAAGWTFSGWSGDLAGATNPVNITMDANKTVTATFTEVPTGLVYSESFNGLATGVQIGNTTGWSDGTGNSPVITAGVGVNGSVGLAPGSSLIGFTWTAHPFSWTDPTVLGVIVGMDFQTDGSSAFDDDRVGWTIATDPSNSNTHFGVQLDPGPDATGGTGPNIECYWDGATDNGGRASIVTLPALAANTFYRLRATFTKLTAGSARIDVTLTQLAGDGTPGAVVATGNIPNTASLPNGPTTQIPLPGYFSAAQMWPVYKAYNGTGGNAADNAYFEILTSAPASYTLTVNVTGSGTVTKNPDNPTYSSGQVVQLTATPAAGFTFTGWSGDLTGTTNPANITMDANKTVTATFAPIQRVLTVNVVGSGTVAKNPDSPTYPHGQVVELTATPAAGWTFTGWSGDLTGTTNPANITMDANKTVTATFAPIQRVLTVNVVGSGTVAKNPDSPTYPHGQVVELTATPAAGWTFSGWSGDLTGATNPANITMDANKTVTGTFTEIPAGDVYAESFDGLTTGIMIGNTTGWEDGAGPSPIITAGIGVNGSNGLVGGASPLAFAWTAHPFTWTDPTVLGVIVGMDFQTTADASPAFDDDRVGWSITSNPATSTNHFGVQLDPVGSSALPQNIECYWDAFGGADIRQNIVTLPALTASTFYRLRATFTKITNGSARIEVTLTQLAADGTPGAVVATGNIPNTASMSVVPDPAYFSAAQMWPVYKNYNVASGVGAADNAYFEILRAAPTTYTLTVNVTGSGTVTKNPDNPTYSSGQVVQLTATPAAGFTFTGWSGDLTGTTNPANITMDANKTVTATFAPFATTWSAVLTVSNSSLNKLLTFGQDESATEGLDAGLNERELPPVPPTGTLDARLLLPTVPAVPSLTDIRPSSRTQAQWILQFQPGSAGYPMTFTWNGAALPGGNFFLRDALGAIVNVDMKTQNTYVLNNAAITSLVIHYDRDVISPLCANIPVLAGWNLLSVPLRAASMDAAVLFPAATSAAYGFDNGYVEATVLENGEGYWLKFDAPASVEVCGSEVGGTLSLVQGWNLVGPFNENVEVAEITTIPGGIITTDFFGFNNGYVEATTLMPGQGYWVKTSAAGTLTFPAGPAKTLATQTRHDPTWPYIQVVDKKGRARKLYLAPSLDGRFSYDMPPVPPVGSFDVRFASNTSVEAGTLAAHDILISGAQFPVSLEFHNMNSMVLRVCDRADGSTLVGRAEDGSIVTLTNPVAKLGLDAIIPAGAPSEYVLNQNYPNPFNPSTRISFNIPAKTEVRLGVYNVLGEMVQSLLSGEVEAGYHEIVFEAGSLPSGLYFYRLESGSFNEIRKMVLMK